MDLNTIYNTRRLLRRLLSLSDTTLSTNCLNSRSCPLF